MGTLFNRLRVGEKIGLSFGLVTLLFFGVIWHYHHSLEGAVQDYASLYDVFEARKSYALEIQDVFSETRRAEKDFLIYREERFAAEVETHLESLLTKANAFCCKSAGAKRISRCAMRPFTAIR